MIILVSTAFFIAVIILAIIVVAVVATRRLHCSAFAVVLLSLLRAVRSV